MIEALCQRYHALPSAVLAEDVSILRRLSLLALAHPPPENDE